MPRSKRPPTPHLGPLPAYSDAPQAEELRDHHGRTGCPHLLRSRHGIWYVRLLTPAALRARYCGIQREIRISTGLGNRRAAAAAARSTLIRFWAAIDYLLGSDMASDDNDERLNRILNGLVRGHERLPGSAGGAARHGIAPMVIDIDPTTSRIRRIESQPHDQPADLAQVLQLLREQQASPADATTATPLERTGASNGLPPPQTSAHSATTAHPTWLSDRISDFLAHLSRAGKHSVNTINYAYTPYLRQFRELVADEVRVLDGTNSWDIHLCRLHPARIDEYVAAMWQFPAQQGRRTAVTDAKAALKGGGPPQSPQNVVKKLNYVLAFASWLAKRGEIDTDAVGRLRAAIDGVAVKTANSDRQDLDLASEDEADEGGYVAFSPSNLARIFHEEVYAAHCAQDPARYFIPLLARYTGGRVNELAQLTVRDLVEFEVTVAGERRSMPCLSITSHERDKHGNVVPVEHRKRRIKSKAGRRTIPLHPELIRLGLLRYRDTRIAEGKNTLFDLPWFQKHGFGKYPGRDFQNLTKAVGVWERRRLVFHSFRATLAQQLEEAGLEPQLIDRVLGHSVKTTRTIHYSRNQHGSTLPLSHVHRALLAIPTEKQVPAWEEVRNQPAQQLSKLVLKLGWNAPARPQATNEKTASGQASPAGD